MRLFGVPGFRRLVTGWSFSNFGDSVLFLTLAIWAKDLTGSDAAAGLVFLFLGLPVFLAPFAGQLADRFSRRRIMTVTNLVAALMVLSLRFVGGPGQIWLIYLVTFLYGILTYTTSAAGAGLIRDMLEDDQLARGNGILNTIDQGLRLLSPLVGAGAYALFGGFAIAVVTSVSLAIASIVFAILRVDESQPEKEDDQPFWDEVTAGLKHLRGVPVLARMTLALGVAFAMTGLANSTIFAVIEQGLGRGAEFFGVLASIQGGGSVLGAITAAALIHRLGERSVVAIALAILGAGLLVAIVPSVAVVIGAVILVGISIPWFVVGFVTLRQRVTPNRLQGRVSAATNMALNGPQTVGTAMGAGLIGVIDYRILMVIMGVSVALCAIPIATFGPQAKSPKRLPDPFTTRDRQHDRDGRQPGMGDRPKHSSPGPIEFARSSDAPASGGPPPRTVKTKRAGPEDDLRQARTFQNILCRRIVARFRLSVVCAIVHQLSASEMGMRGLECRVATTSRWRTDELTGHQLSTRQSVGTAENEPLSISGWGGAIFLPEMVPERFGGSEAGCLRDPFD